MVLKSKKVRELFKKALKVTLGICFFIVLIKDPFKQNFLPPLKQFVTTHIDSLLNFLLHTFLICSSVLVVIVYLIFQENKKDKSKFSKYASQLVAKDYYKGYKKIDYAKAVASSLYKYSRMNLEEQMRLEASAPGEEKKQDGTYKSFYPNGQLKLEENYKDGKLEGIYRNYYEEGHLHQERTYKQGLLNGAFKAYDQNGVLYFETHYKDDKKDGTENTYYMNGVVQYQDTYKDGLLLNRKTYDENGELKFSENFLKNESVKSKIR